MRKRKEPNLSRTLAAALMVCAAAVPVRSEEPAAAAALVGEVVITASRRPVAVENTPAVVDVITAEEIARTPATTLANLLETKAGIYTFQPQGTGIVTPQDVRLRGTFGTDRILLLLDGQPVDEPYTNYWYLSQIPLEAVERIEVVRGPFSALYGSNAMGGVIHVFTKDGRGAKGATSSVGFKAGDFGRREWTATASASNGGAASLFLSYRDAQTDSYLLNDSDAEDVVRDGTDNREVSQQRVHAHGRYRPSERLDLHLTGGWLASDTGFGTSPVTVTEKQNEITQWYGNLRGTSVLGPGLEAFFGVDYLWRDRPTDGDTALDEATVVASVNTNQSRRLRGTAGAHWEVFAGNTLSFGAEWTRIWAEHTIESESSGDELAVFLRPAGGLDTQETNFALFVQDDWTFLDDRLELVLGGRYDNYGETEDAFSPKGSLIWRYLATGRAKLSAGRAFRAPSVSERKSPFWNLTVQPYPFPVVPPPGQRYFAVSWLANEDLDAETVDSYELSLENEFFERKLSTRVTPYYVRGKDFIASVSVPDPLAPSYPVAFPPPGSTMQSFSTLTAPTNIDEVVIKAVEAEVTLRPWQPVSLFTNYLYQDARDRESGRQLEFYPYNVLHAGANWYSRHLGDFVGVGVGVVGRYLSDYRYSNLGGRESGTLDGFGTVDAKLGLDFWKRRLLVTAEMFNVFDRDGFYHTTESVLPDRNYLIGAELRLEL